MNAQKICILFSIFLLPLLLFGQKTVFQRIENMPENTKSINCIEIENDSILWIGTNLGVMKIQNNTLELVQTEKLYERIKVNTITIDENNTKWFGTYSSSLVRYKNENDYEEVSFVEHTNSEKQLVTAIKATDKEIIIGTSEGILLSCDKNLSAFEIKKTPPINAIHAIDKTESGIFWLATPCGLYLEHENGKWKFDKTFMQVSGFANFNTSLFLYGRNKKQESVIYWLSNKKKWKQQPLENLPDSFIKFNAIEFDTKGNIWIATNYGIIKYDNKRNTCKTYNTAKYKDFNIREAKCIALQNDRIIWVSSRGGVLYKINL